MESILKKIIKIGRSKGIIIPFHLFNSYKNIKPSDYVTVTYIGTTGDIVISRLEIEQN